MANTDILARVQLEENVARGISLLDAKRSGWDKEIDLSILVMKDGCQCILGQLAGEFVDGCSSLGITIEQAPDYGFDFNDKVDMQFRDQYRTLEDIWVKRIRERWAAQ